MNPTPSSSLPSARSLPLAVLLNHTADAVQAVRAGRSLDDALARCPAEARPGTQALSFHVLRWLGSAQAVRARLAPKPPAPAVDALLLTALALLWPDAAPPYADHTVVDQAVTAAAQRAPAAAAFVNAVLRRFLRERAGIAAAVVEREPAARFNHPAWWIERLRADWPADWPALLQANQQHPPMALRVNTRRGSMAAYLRRLAAAGIQAHPAPAVAPQGVLLAEPCPVGRLPGFADGDVSVQDVAAQRAASLLIGAGLRAGARVLDACSAPGGKAAHLLELAEVDLLAIDCDAQRLELVHGTLARLGLRASTRAADAAQPATWWTGEPFDAILLDAPCSASGIVRRHPDVRWLRRPGDVPRLAQLQARLLDALWPLLAPGGRLLFCTCSVFKAEGQGQIDAFLQRQPQARLAESPVSPGHLLPLNDNSNSLNGAAPALPGDGFFYALLEKNH